MKKIKGFTLIEILIVILIIGILATVAVYNYRNYILRSHRVDAMKLLLDTAAKEENFYSFKYKYTDKLSDLGLASTESDYKFYVLSITLGANAKSYTLKATPQGAQASDQCGTFELTNDGKKTAATSDCWN